MSLFGCLASLVVGACMVTVAHGADAPGSAQGQRLRLVLVGGAQYEVSAPLTEQGPLLVFRLDNGRLVSLQRSRVLEIVRVDHVRVVPDAKPQSPSSVETETPRFTNSDLSFAPPDLPPSDVPVPERPPLPVPGYADVPEVEDEYERPRLEARAFELLEELEVLRTRERVWRAFLECERAGIPIRDCKPEVNRVNRGVNRIRFPTPNERSLVKQLEELQLLQEKILAELEMLGVEPSPEEPLPPDTAE